MRLLKMPIVDTKIPGLRMAYGDDEETMNTPMMGESPAGGKVIDMSPNEYFDIVGEDAEKHNEPIVPDRDAKYRWFGRRFGPEGGSEQNIARIIEGIKENKVMGAPVLHFNQDKYTGVQEGGHRMEALRQMGHGDTQVPIVTYNTNYEKGSPMDRAMRLLKRQTELGEFHPDLPSSHGEVKWLHGTPETNVDSIRRLGVLPNDGSDGGHGAFVTDNPMSASGYVKNAPVAYIGVREGAGEPEPRVTPSLATQAFPEGIPPQFLTVMPKSPFTQDMYRADALGQEQFRLPAENVRLRNYFDRMTGDNQYELQRIQDMGRTIDERGAEHVV